MTYYSLLLLRVGLYLRQLCEKHDVDGHLKGRAGSGEAEYSRLWLIIDALEDCKLERLDTLLPKEE